MIVRRDEIAFHVQIPGGKGTLIYFLFTAQARFLVYPSMNKIRNLLVVYD